MPVYIYSMYKKVAKYNKTKMKFLKIEMNLSEICRGS